MLGTEVYPPRRPHGARERWGTAEIDQSTEGLCLPQFADSGPIGLLPDPSVLVVRGNPDRDLSVDNRLVSDFCAVNSGVAKEDRFPICAPPIVDIVGEIQRRRRRFPNMTAMLLKRDTDGGANRIFIHPDLSKLEIAELRWRLLGLGENVMASHVELPAGRVASPAYFRLFGTVIHTLRESDGIADIGRPGRVHLPRLYMSATPFGWGMRPAPG